MNKFYAVKIAYTAIIKANSPEEAEAMANRDSREIVGDSFGPDEIKVLDEVKGQDQLKQFGWEGMCLPYGDTAGNTRLSEYLPEITP